MSDEKVACHDGRGGKSHRPDGSRLTDFGSVARVTACGRLMRGMTETRLDALDVNSLCKRCWPTGGGPMTEDNDWGYEQMLRADRAELALQEADRKLARLMQLADSWEETWGDKGVKANMIASAVRVTIRPSG